MKGDRVHLRDDWTIARCGFKHTRLTDDVAEVTCGTCLAAIAAETEGNSRGIWAKILPDVVTMRLQGALEREIAAHFNVTTASVNSKLGRMKVKGLLK